MVIKLPTSAVPFLYKQDPILQVDTDAKKVVSLVGEGDWEREIQGADKLTLNLIARKKVTWLAS